MAIRLLNSAALWRRRGLDLLFPPRCACCDADIGPSDGELALCGACRAVLGPAPWPWCPHCGAGVQEERETAEGCQRCHGASLWFDRVIPLGIYRDELRTAVLRMKKRAGDHLSEMMGRLYALQRGETLAALEPDLVVAVPMHWMRRLFRGTNNPEIVARQIAGHLGARLAPGMLFRSRNTLPQADLTPGQRFQNVRGAFGLRAGYDLRGKKVIVVDDILTTGATCSEVAKVLKQAGVAMVVAAALARAEGPKSR